MNVYSLDIPDVLVIEPDVYEDDRGFFFESFNQKAFEESTGLSPKFVQDNHSKSSRGVLRGLHFQVSPMAQGKLVRVVSGEIFDVAVDLRHDSTTFGKWVSETLSSDNKKQLWIPEGFAHGFLTLSDTVEILYKVTNYYDQEYEHCLFWNDHKIGIDWPPNIEPILSPKDEQALAFSDTRVFA
jgi:dTDP-4-dehydrorhamnose 3,5-epimerase